MEALEEGTDKQSGGTRDKDKWKSKSRDKAKGMTEELGEHVYKVRTNDQADLFIKTTDAIGDYVGTKYGWDLRILVKQRQEAVFTKPTLPTRMATRSKAKEDTTEDEGALIEYKAELSIYYDKVDTYQANKAKVFVVILGQCTVGVKGWLEQGRGLAKLEADRDVVGLLNLLETMAFSNGGDQDPFLTLVNSLKKLANIQQGPKEHSAKYYNRLKVASDVLIRQWGDFFPSTLVTNSLPKEAVKDRLLARIFLAGADQKRFGSLLEDLNNSYIGGNDKYPKTLEDTQKLLSSYQGPKNPSKTDDSKEDRGRSFAQGGKYQRITDRSSSPESTTGESVKKKKNDKKSGKAKRRSPSPLNIGWSS